jgi:hypothetical protein
VPRQVTLTFADDTTATYNNVPDEVTPDEVISRVGKDFPDRQLTRVTGKYLEAAPAPAPTTAPTPAPAQPEAKPEAKPSFWDRYAGALQLGGEQYVSKEGTFTPALVRGAKEVATGYREGLGLLRSGKAPSTSSLLKSRKEQQEDLEKLPENVRAQLEREANASAPVKEAEKIASVWQTPEAGPIADLLDPEGRATREAAIKSRMKTAGLEDTPKNRDRVREQDLNDVIKAKQNRIGVQLSGLKSWDNVKRIVGEQAFPLFTSYIPAAIIGGLSRSPTAAGATIGLTAAPLETLNRYTVLVDKVLEKRGLKFDEEGLDTLKKEGLLDEIASIARVGGSVDSAFLSLTSMLGPRVASSSYRRAAKQGEKTAIDRNAVMEARKRAAVEGRMGEEPPVSATDKARAKARTTPEEINRATLDELAKVSTATRVAETATGSVANLAAPVVGQIAGDIASGQEINTEAARDKFLGNLPFIPFEIGALRGAYTNRAAITKSQPENIAKKDIDHLWNERYPKAETDEGKEAALDSIGKIHQYLYHSTGAYAKDRAHLREKYAADMRKLADGYTQLLDIELAKPKEEQNAERIAGLKSKIEMAEQSHLYTSPHPAMPELTVEEAQEFMARSRGADSIPDPAEADKVRQQIKTEIDNLVGERRAKTKGPGAVDRGEVGEAGEPAARTAGEGVKEPVSEGVAPAPGSEGVGTAGLGGAGRAAGRPDVGEAAGPITLSDVNDAIRKLRNPKSTRDEITALADRFKVPYDPQEETFDINRRVRERVIDFNEAFKHEAQLGGDEEDIFQRRGGKLGAVDHDLAIGLGEEYAKAWNADINVANGVEELRQLSGRDVADDVRGFYDPETRKVWINSQNHSNLADVKSTIFHETLGHYGLSKKFRADLDNLLLDIYNKNEGIRKEVDAWQKRKISDTETNKDTYGHLDSEKQIARAVEELLAEKSEAGRIQTGAFRQLVALVRKYLRRLPKVGERMQYSDNDILHILRDAHEEVIKGKDTYEVGPDGGLRYSYIGPQARLTEAEKRNLALAERLETEGVNPLRIRDATGFIRNPADGKWRLEQSDHRAKLKIAMSAMEAFNTSLMSKLAGKPEDIKYMSMGKEYALSEVLQHTDLFDRYPELKNVRVSREELPAEDHGFFNSDNNYIGINRDLGRKDFLETLMHEVQHWIQVKEGFAVGGGPASVLLQVNRRDRKKLGEGIASILDATPASDPARKAKSDFLNLFKAGTIEDIRNGDIDTLERLAGMYANNSPALPDSVRAFMHEAYENLTGEIEARATASRLKMTPAERRREPFDFRRYERSFAVWAKFAEGSAAQKIAESSMKPLPKDREENIKYSKGQQRDLSKARDEMNRFDRTVYDKLMNKLSDLGAGRHNIIKILDTSKLAFTYESKLPAVRLLDEITGRVQVRDSNTDLELQKKVTKWADAFKGDPEELSKLSDVAHDTTITQIDPRDANTNRLYDELKAKPAKKRSDYERQVEQILDRYSKLSPEARKVYGEMRDYYDGVRERTLDAVKKYAGEGAANKLRAAIIENGLQVYFPLVRQGDYWLEYTDSNGVFRTMAVNHPRQQAKIFKELTAAGNRDVKMFTRTEKSGGAPPPSGLLNDVLAEMRSNGASEALINSVAETFLDYSNSGSVMQLFRKRQGYEGFNPNILNSFMEVAPGMEKNIANFEYRQMFNDAMSQLNEQILTNIPGAYSLEKLPTEYAILKEHLENHVDVMLSPPVYKGLSKIADKASKFILPFNYVYTIAARASTGLWNFTSTPTLSVPQLASQFSLGKSVYAHKRALDMYMGGGFETSHVDLVPDWTAFANATGEYKLLGEKLLDIGVITRNNGADFDAFRKIDPKDWNRRLQGMQRITGFIMQNTERANREITALAAYMLKRESGASIDDATKFAIRHTQFIHGPGALSTTAPMLKHPVGRVLMNMRRWPLTMMYQQGRLLKAATYGVDDITRGLAARQLAATMVHSGLLLGAKGMPFMGAVGLTLTALHSMGLIGDKDVPFNPDEFIAENTGVFNGGLLDKALGIDSSSASLADLVWKDNAYDLRKSGVPDYILHQLGGVTYSTLTRFADGIKKATDGEWEAAADALIPPAGRGIFRAIRYATEGVNTSSGTPMVDDKGRRIKLGAYDYFMTALGFTPTDIAEYQRRHRNIMEDYAILTKDLEASIRREYNRTIKKGDIEGAVKAAEALARNYSKNGRIPKSEIFRRFLTAPANAAKDEMMAVDGVRASLRDRAFIMERSERNK